MLVALLAYEPYGTLNRPGAFMGPPTREGIEHISYGDHSGDMGDVFTRESIGVAAAVPFFVMVQRYNLRRMQQP